MASFQLVTQIEENIPKLNRVSEGNRGELMTALYWWYKDYAKYHYAEPPNIDSLLNPEDERENYLQNVVDAVAGTIIEEEGWEPEAAESYSVAYDIINCNWEEIVEELHADIRMVFDSIQLFHADGIVAENQNGYVNWAAEMYYHSPLQEVW